MTEDGLPGSKQRITQCDTNLSMTAPMPNNHEAWTNFGNNNHIHNTSSNNLTVSSSNIASTVNVVDKTNESDQIIQKCHITWSMLSHMT